MTHSAPRKVAHSKVAARTGKPFVLVQIIRGQTMKLDGYDTLAEAEAGLAWRRDPTMPRLPGKLEIRNNTK